MRLRRDTLERRLRALSIYAPALMQKSHGPLRTARLENSSAAILGHGLGGKASLTMLARDP